MSQIMMGLVEEVAMRGPVGDYDSEAYELRKQKIRNLVRQACDNPNARMEDFDTPSSFRQKIPVRVSVQWYCGRAYAQSNYLDTPPRQFAFAKGVLHELEIWAQIADAGMGGQ